MANSSKVQESTRNLSSKSTEYIRYVRGKVGVEGVALKGSPPLESVGSNPRGAILYTGGYEITFLPLNMVLNSRKPQKFTKELLCFC